MHFAQLGLTIEGVGVDVDLAIQAVQVALRGDHQRVDLQQREVAVEEHLAQTHEDLGELFDLIADQTQLEGQLAGLIGLRANQRIQGGLVDQMGVSWAIFSMSTPPSVEAMKTTRREPRSTTAPR